MSDKEEDAKKRPVTDKSLPKWLVQIGAWVTGIVGVYADYGLLILGDNHIPIIFYGLCVGVGFGLNPESLTRFIGGGKK